MSRCSAVLGIALFYVAAPVLGAELLAKMPMQFQGRWNADVQLCRLGGDSQLEIRANDISFFESAGPIVTIVAQGTNDLALIAELSGEGQTYLSARHFQLSEDGQELVDISTPTHFLRHRCP